MNSIADASANLARAKRELRRTMRAELAARPPTRDSVPRLDLVLQLLDALPAARVVSVFLSLPDEISTRPLLDPLIARYGAIAVPRVAGPGLLEMRRVDRADGPFRPGSFSIPEPAPEDFPETFDPGELDLVFVPGLAFDANGNRLGRGAGYYDRLLASAPRSIAVGLCLDRQIVERVPVDAGDVPVGAIVAETLSIRPAGFPSKVSR